MEEINKKYAWISLISGAILGILSIILFTWHQIGGSFAIFSFISVFLALIPPILVEGKKGLKKYGLASIFLLLLLPISLLFVYRMSVDMRVLAFMLLPILYTISLISAYNRKVCENMGVLAFIAYPIILSVSWFVDLFKFVPNLKTDRKVSQKTKSRFWRVILGVLISLPFIALFLALLISADNVFAQYMEEFFKTTIYEWFKDWPTTIATIGKLIVGFIVFVYFSVFNFSLVNDKSFVHKLMSKVDWISLKNWDRKWDVIIATVFMFLINLLFVTFVVIQFVYLFGGERNVSGLTANFTYAQYARRGFFELMAVSSIVFIIAFILNFKVYTQGFWQKFLFRFNHALMVISVLVISYSANSRLMLYESAYGYTPMRLFVHGVILVVALMYITLYLSLLCKKGEQVVNRTLGYLAIVLILIALATPLDFVSAKLNYMRYQSTGKIDLSYLKSLSNEVVPVLFEISENGKVSESIKYIVMSDVKRRYEELKPSRDLKIWEKNIFDRMLEKEIKKIYLEEDWDSKVTESFETFLESYMGKIAAGKFDEAYEDHWSSATEKIEIGNAKVYIFSYQLQENTSVILADWLVNGGVVRIYPEVYLSWQKDKDSLYEYVDSSDTVEIINENGEWKIRSASVVKLGDIVNATSYKGWVHLENYNDFIYN